MDLTDGFRVDAVRLELAEIIELILSERLREDELSTRLMTLPGTHDKVSKEAAHLLWHWHSDADIRAKDANYADQQRGALHTYLLRLRAECR